MEANEMFCAVLDRISDAEGRYSREKQLRLQQDNMVRTLEQELKLREQAIADLRYELTVQNNHLKALKETLDAFKNCAKPDEPSF
jgi:septal ring factor EnvC (AmiA/AmiB activator)